MDENKQFNVKVENDNLVFGADFNKDGEPSIKGKLSLTEAIKEAFMKGTAVEGVKVASLKFALTKLIVVIDTDKDGQNLLEIEVDLAEGLDEAGLIKN